MRKMDVVIGGRYTAKISGKLTIVVIEGVNSFGGWFGRNEETHRLVRIKSAQKLRSVVSG